MYSAPSLGYILIVIMYRVYWFLHFVMWSENGYETSYQIQILRPIVMR